MDAAEMAEVQPGLAPRFTHGTFTPGWFSVADPKVYTEALAARVRAPVLHIADAVAVELGGLRRVGSTYPLLGAGELALAVALDLRLVPGLAQHGVGELDLPDAEPLKISARTEETERSKFR